ncbi:hypothetical protein AB4F11_04220 [Francisella philomiragia]
MSAQAIQDKYGKVLAELSYAGGFSKYVEEVNTALMEKRIIFSPQNGVVPSFDIGATIDTVM